MKIRKGDTVLVIAGKDKGRTGKVDRVYPKQNKVVVESINMYKKAVPKTEQTPQGGVMDVPRPIQASNLMVVDPKTKKPSRVKYEIKDGKKERVFKSTSRKKI
ncbi:50S ribosomal protein L24 [Candidatus Roizmanbacteria bacterium]|nr:MAG: 50S ribosomal protein L24 [Candidatus Roizmanbacteria bacterium]